MAVALGEARRALRRGEVPVGAVVVAGGEIVARAHNQTIRSRDPTAHAEVLALRRAARRLGSHRLLGAHVYVTLEPCAMCVGAMIQARVASLCFACRDPKAGAVVSLYALASDRRLNHRIPFREDVLAAECRDLLRGFFRARRAAQRRRSGSAG
ncbi:MAG: nucleoside deaminase [Deltaproteobacteria bacterium]|nr:nucleoside deaminase [Deltaproteobacteria bacterium]